MEPVFSPNDFSLDSYTGEELRGICQEAIARGEAFERAKKAARQRALKCLIVAVMLWGAVFAAELFLYR